MSNSFGKLFRFTSFGESHGKLIGGVIDGMPSGIEINENYINNELAKRKPGQSQLTTQRKEKDKIQIVSGIFNGKTTGTPIAFFIENSDAKSKHYEKLKNIFRPGHADYTYQQKYEIRDWRGGGRQSARETAIRVVAGAFAKLILKKFNIKIYAFTSQMGKIKQTKTINELDLSKIYRYPTRCPDTLTDTKMQELILQYKQKKDSIGGVVSCVVTNVPVGLGEPVYDKLNARLAYAIMSINACKGFEIGKGFEVAQMTGSQNNDPMTVNNGEILFLNNNAGGILGGISTGQNIFFRAAFKPTPSIGIEQQTITTNKQNTKIKITGRHDPCIVPRAVVVVEAMTAVTLVDFILLNNSLKFEL